MTISAPATRPHTDDQGEPIPPAGSAAVRAILDEIAADCRRRLDEDSVGPPLLGLDLVRRHRLGAIRLPAEIGGGGYSVAQFFDWIIDLAEADPDLAHALRIHYSIVEELGRPTIVPTSLRLRQFVVDGDLIGGATAEQSDHTVGAHQFDTTLTETADGYVLDGRKFYSTGAQFSDHLRITAADDDGNPVSATIPAHRDGVVHLDDWDGIGQRQTGSGTTVLRAVAVSDAEVTPVKLRPGIDRPRSALVQLHLHAIAAGILRSLTTDAAALVRGRHRTYTHATAPEPAADPQILEVVGQISATAYTAQALVRDAAAAQERSIAAARTTGIDPALEDQAAITAAKVKVAIEEPALRAAGRIFDAGGASSVRQATHLDRHWRNLRTLFSHNPTVYKARVLGDIEVNGATLPDSGYF